jgi:type IV secretion system protein TrbI
MNESPNPAPSVQKNTVSPPGLLPRNTQAWVIGGISVLMVLVIAFSGRNPPKERHSVPAAGGLEADAARIEEYKRQMDQEAEKLQMEKTRLARTQGALAAASNPGPTSLASLPPQSTHASMDEDSLEADRRKREYQSLFASNLALSYRPEPLQATPATVLTAAEPFKAQPPTTPNADPAAKAPEPKSKLYRLFEGTVLETVLTNRLDGSFSGQVNCMVTTDVYSHNAQHLLIPQGTRVLGDVRKVETLGQERLAVTFHRMIMPDGYSLNLDKFQGLNQIGETGLRDQINHHYVQVFGVSLAIGAIAGLSQSNTQYGINESAGDAYRQGAATSLSQSSLQILDRYLNVLPTFTIREGQRVKIYLSDDLLVPAYDQHPVADDI